MDRFALARHLIDSGHDPRLSWIAGPNRMADQRPPSELRSGNTPMGDYVGQHVSPYAGQLASALEKYGTAPAKIAVDMAKQPVRAGDAVSEALADPSLPNVTNAGMQVGMMFPTVKGAAVAGGAAVSGMGAALARELLSPTTADAAGLTRDQEARKRELQEQIRRQKWGSGTERRMIENELGGLLEIERNAASAANKAETDRQSQADASKQAEYDRAVLQAEALRDQDLSRRRRFSETEVGKVYNKIGGAPALAAILAGGAGALDRLAKGAPKSAVDYLRIGAEGTGAASLGNNVSLIYDALATDPDNPEKAAFQTYARELPEGHPKKATAKAYADALQADNPVRSTASAELYDPLKLAERLGMSIVEGVPSAITGANIPGAVKKVGQHAVAAPSALAESVGRVPGSLVRGYREEMASASASKAIAPKVEPPAEPVAIPKGLKANDAWQSKSDLARQLIADELSSGKSFVSKGKADSRVMPQDIAAGLNDAGHKVSVQTVQGRMDAGRKILQANGIDPARVSASEFLAMLKRADPAGRYLALPLAVTGGAALSQDDRAKLVEALLSQPSQ